MAAINVLLLVGEFRQKILMTLADLPVDIISFVDFSNCIGYKSKANPFLLTFEVFATFPFFPDFLSEANSSLQLLVIFTPLRCA